MGRITKVPQLPIKKERKEEMKEELKALWKEAHELHLIFITIVKNSRLKK